MSETLSNDRQFVTFHVRSDLFGVKLTDVQEIIRMPDLVQVPLCPPGLEGIANLRGAVLPVTNLRHLFGAEPADHDDATRVVVMNRGGSPVGFVVDRMASVITAEAEEIENTASIESTVQSDMLRGVVKRAGSLILLLDPARLTTEGSAAQARSASGATTFSSGTNGVTTVARSETEAGVPDEIQLVSFEADAQEYAFAIDDVQEIVQVPGTVTQVPQAQPHVVGVMTLRDRLLPLVSLRRMFGLAEAALDEHSRIVVVSSGDGGMSVGIVTDNVKEVLRVGRALTDPMPALLTAADAGGPTAFEAICRLDGGKRLVTILSAAKMFRDAALRAAIATAATDPNDAAGEDMRVDASEPGPGASNDAEEQFVVFRLAGEEYGVSIEAVQEIVRVPEDLTHVPKAAAFMEGVVNLRGTVLPVVDQRRRFALQEIDRNDRQRIMVLTIGGVRTGFIVDQVSEVLKISRAAIGPAPALSQEQQRLIRRVANLESQGRMILLLDPANLLEAGELAALEKI
jgi:purine-binding chemotaxis protein CheW